MYQKISQELNKLKNPAKAKILQKFFKTNKGEYGEGDIFLGITVPQQRKIVKKYFQQIKLSDIQKLLNSKIHEYRLVGVLILVEKYKKNLDKSLKKILTPTQPVQNYSKKQIFDFYLKNTQHINNWDLVDLSAPNIVGDYLLDRDKKILYKLAKSKNLWQRRISILATFAFIHENQFHDTINLSRILLKDSHDLIHKAVGWMLREMGKRDEKELIEFLDKHTAQMPRTMLRYAIEKLPEKKRKYYLNKK